MGWVAPEKQERRRKAILALVKAEPGITTPEITRRFFLPGGAARNICRKLERAGLVTCDTDGQGNHWYLAKPSSRKRKTTKEKT